MAKRDRRDIFDHPVTGHMQPGVTVVRESQTISEAIASLQAHPPERPFFYVFAVNDQGQLVGVLPTRKLLLTSGETQVAAVMDHHVVTIPQSATVLEACEFFIQHRYLALPVVDHERRPLGLVDVELFTDGVFDAAEQRSRDDIFQLIGIHVRRSQRGAPWSGLRDRFPWLLANMLGGACCALLTSRFENLFSSAIAVAMFVPIVLTLSESVSIQSMSILLESLHAGPVGWRFGAAALARELAVAALLGSASGGLVGLTAGLWQGSVWLALALAGSIGLSIVSAGLLGLVLPILVRALRADPRIAAGPIVLASTDVVTLGVYLLVCARVLLG